MSYRIEIAPAARIDIRRLSGYLRAQAVSLISALAREPLPPRAKKLRDEPAIYRIWLAGRWRIAYELDAGDSRLLILLVRGEKRAAFDSLSSWMKEAETGYDNVGVATRDRS